MPPDTLKRQVGIWGAVLMGLGSIVGTGVFVSIGIGFQLAGKSVLPAILIATLVATFNGLSSAQLAANHPVSGGTYAYGYRWLNPFAGFSAGALFLIAKSASAATAALGCAIYILELSGFDLAGSGSKSVVTGLALCLVIVVTLLVAGGVKRSNRLNICVVSLTLLGLLTLIVAGLMAAAGDPQSPKGSVSELTTWGPDFWRCCALMFVAFTGYGRIATLGEEILQPERNIPRAIIITLVISGILYAAVGAVFVLVGSDLVPGVSGSPEDSDTLAVAGQVVTLKALAAGFDWPGVQFVVSLAAITAMLGVLLNLILGLSRVWYSMGRNGDLPAALGRLNQEHQSPVVAVFVTGMVIGG